MSEQRSVHAQQAADAWGKACEDHMARMTAFTERLGQMEAQALEQARAAVDEAARLQKETLAHWAELGASMRSIALDTARQSAAFWRGGA